MAITFVNKGAFNSGAAGLTIAQPASTAANDLLLLFIETENQSISVTSPSGWTEVTGSPVTTGTAGAAGGVRLTVFYKIHSGSEASVVITDSGDHQAAIILAYRDIDTFAPFDVTPVSSVTTPASTTLTLPGITTATANAWIVHAAALDLDSASTTTTGAATNANLTGITERHDQTIATGDGGGLVIIDGVKASIGATGNTTATVTSTIAVHLTMALSARTTALAATPAATATLTAALTSDPIADLFDAFEGGSLNTAKWTNTSTGLGSATLTGGRLRLNGSTAAIGGIESLRTYSLTGAGVYFGTANITTVETIYFGVRSSASSGYNFLYDALGDLICRRDSVGQGIGVAYSATTHAWLRIRESAGTVYWDSAPSSASNPPAPGDWVNLQSATVTSAVTAITVYLETYGTVSANTEFDCVNTSLTGGGNATVALVGAATTSAAGSLSTSGGASTALTGVSHTASAGTLAGGGGAVTTLSGAATASTAGTVTGAGGTGATVALAGAATASAAGTAAGSGGATAAIVGVSQASAAGALVASASATTALGGAQTTATAGILTASVGTNAVATLVGAGATSAGGTLAPAGGAAVALSGAQSTSSAGALTSSGGAAGALTGAQATSAAGTVVATGSSSASVALSGAATVSAAGIAVGSGGASTALVGAQAASSSTSPTASGGASVALAGAQATSTAGAIVASAGGDAAAALGGASTASAAGTLTAAAGAAAALGGASTASAAGTLTAAGGTTVVTSPADSEMGKGGARKKRRPFAPPQVDNGTAGDWQFNDLPPELAADTLPSIEEDDAQVLSLVRDWLDQLEAV